MHVCTVHVHRQIQLTRTILYSNHSHLILSAASKELLNLYPIVPYEVCVHVMKAVLKQSSSLAQLMFRKESGSTLFAFLFVSMRRWPTNGAKKR